MAIIIITLCITGLEFYALHKGLDGKLLLAVIGTLSTMAGWQSKKQQIERRKNVRGHEETGLHDIVSYGNSSKEVKKQD